RRRPLKDAEAGGGVARVGGDVAEAAFERRHQRNDRLKRRDPLARARWELVDLGGDLARTVGDLAARVAGHDPPKRAVPIQREPRVPVAEIDARSSLPRQRGGERTKAAGAPLEDRPSIGERADADRAAAVARGEQARRALDDAKDRSRAVEDADLRAPK